MNMFEKFKKNFTWKKFILIFIFLVLFTMAGAILIQLIAGERIQKVFEADQMIRRSLIALVLAFFIAGSGRATPQSEQ